MLRNTKCRGGWSVEMAPEGGWPAHLVARLRVDKALRRLELDHQWKAALAVWLELGKRVLGQVVDAAPRARAVVGAAGAGGAGAAVAADLVLVVRPAAAAVLDERLAGDRRRRRRRRSR